MVKEVSVSLLKEAAYNPRVYLTKGDRDWQKIERSIDQFGYVEPIVWNERTGNVVGGHQRLKVLKEMGYETIPVSVVNLSEKDEKQLNLALNKIKGEWDYEKLSDLLMEFQPEDLLCSGFTADEVSLLLSEDDTDEDDYSWMKDWNETTELHGESAVVTLKFDSFEEAEQWADEHGYPGQFKKNSKTTVIRVETDYE